MHILGPLNILLQTSDLLSEFRAPDVELMDLEFYGHSRIGWFY